MYWSEVRHLPGSDGGVLLGESSGGPSSSLSPQIKNHSVTHHRGYLYCFGGYDGRRNHQTLWIYSLKEQRWITPSLSSGSIVDRNGDGGDGTGSGHDNSNNNFDHGSININISSSNSPPIQHYTVRGVLPPGRNGHTATLATITRRRQLRRQQQHRDASLLVIPRIALREDNANDFIYDKSLMGTTFSNLSWETTQQQHHYHFKANGLEDLTKSDNVVNAVGNVMNDDVSTLDACHEESGEELDEAVKDDATDYNLNKAKVLDGLLHCHQVKQVLSPSKDEVIPVVGLNEQENDTCNIIANNNINPMENDENDSGEYNGNSDEYDAQIIIIGGWLGAGPLAASDTWVLDISGGLDRLEWFQPVSLSNSHEYCLLCNALLMHKRNITLCYQYKQHMQISQF